MRLTCGSSARPLSSAFEMRPARALRMPSLRPARPPLRGDARRAVRVVVELDDDVGVADAIGELVQLAIELGVVLLGRLAGRFIFRRTCIGRNGKDGEGREEEGDQGIPAPHRFLPDLWRLTATISYAPLRAIRGPKALTNTLMSYKVLIIMEVRPVFDTSRKAIGSFDRINGARDCAGSIQPAGQLQAIYRTSVWKQTS